MPRLGYLLAVDPGLDLVAVAVFELDAYFRALGTGALQATAAIRAYHDVLRFTTSAQGDDVERAAAVGTWLGSVVRQHQPARVWIEKPRYAGAFGKKNPRQAADSLRKLNLATGALAAAALLSGAVVREIEPAGRIAGMKDAKESNRLQVNHLLRLAGRAELKQQDCIDAIWLGVRALAALRIRRRETATQP